MNDPEFVFPTGFLWGSATSAHQVEGNNRHSDWWAWEQAGRVKERSGLACDHYRRFADDFDLAVSLGHNTHRCSIEWSRLEPAEGRWDDAALAHYVEVVRALRARRLEPLLTLHHFTTPQWLAEQGGWANPKVVEAFGRYVRRVRDALGDLVRDWITINEPMVFVRMHYLQGLGPPGARDLKQGVRVLEHLLRAHAAAYHLLHEMRAQARPAPRVSVAQYVPVFRPCHWWSPLDRGIAYAADRIFNAAVFDTLTLGRLTIPGVLSRSIPDAAHTLDFVGVNFYGRQFVHARCSRAGLPGEGCDLAHHPKEVTERTGMGWDVHPESFVGVLTRLARMRLPILVTENGAFMTDDARRWSYLERHVQAMARAMQAGAPVIGYYYWSLLDNFEWADGFGPRFGLIEIDYASQQRRVRDSARRYAAVCRANRIRV